MTETRHDTSAASEALKRMRAHQPGADENRAAEERTTPATAAGPASSRAQVLPPRPTRMPAMSSPPPGVSAPVASAATATGIADPTSPAAPVNTREPDDRNAAGVQTGAASASVNSTTTAHVSTPASPLAHNPVAAGSGTSQASPAAGDTSISAPAPTSPAVGSPADIAAAPAAPTNTLRPQRDAAARHMAAIPPQRAKVEHDAPKKLNDWLDHLPAPDWKAIGSRLKGNAVALRHRRRDRTEQRELRRVEQVKARHSLEATDGAPPAGATVGVEAADQSPSRTTGNAAAAASNNAYPVKESAAALHGGAEAPSGMPGSTAAAAAEPGPAVAQPAGATKPRAADVDLAALVESARAAIRARATEADAHSYTVLSADAAPEVGLPGMASGAALGARAHARDGSRNAVVGSGSAIVAGDSGSGTVDGDSGSGTVDGDSGLGFAAVARNIVTGVTDPRPTDQELRDASPFWVDDDEPLYVPPYNLPSRTPDPPENQQDRLRRAVVAGAAVVALLLGFLGLGLFGGDTAHSGVDSPFRPRAALLSPGVDSFMIWGLIFCWIVVFAVYQWHPSQRSSPRQRDLGYPTAGAALLGALWLLAARAGMAATAMWIAIALTAVLVYCLRLMNQRTARDNAERICVDAPGALFLGWMLTVLPMSVGVYLTSRGADFLLPGSWWATLTIIGATWAAASFSMSERGRIVLAIGFGWGLFWIMLVRLLGPTFSTPVAIVAGLCAFIVLLATENRRYQIGHAERRAARGQRTEF